MEKVEGMLKKMIRQCELFIFVSGMFVGLTVIFVEVKKIIEKGIASSSIWIVFAAVLILIMILLSIDTKESVEDGNKNKDKKLTNDLKKW